MIWDAETSLEKTDLSERTVKELREEGVETVGELMGLARRDLGSMRALGTLSIREILTFQDSWRAPDYRSRRKAQSFSR